MPTLIQAYRTNPKTTHGLSPFKRAQTAWGFEYQEVLRSLSYCPGVCRVTYCHGPYRAFRVVTVERSDASETGWRLLSTHQPHYMGA